VVTEAVFVTAKSADAVTVVVTLAVLLVGTGSVSVAATEAVLVMLPAATGLTMIVTVAVAAFASVPMEQVTVVVPEQVPCVETAETKVGPAGSVSVRFTFVAGDGPLLVIVSV